MKSYEFAKKLIKKYASLSDEDAILPHVQENLTELKKDIDYLVEFGGVDREAIVNLIVKLLSFSPSKNKPSDVGGTPKDKILNALKVMQSENPREALFSIKDLRSRINLNKEEFDKVALELSRENKVSLHFHDYPQALSESERNNLVHDTKNDIYYIGIALRS